MPKFPTKPDTGCAAFGLIAVIAFTSIVGCSRRPPVDPKAEILVAAASDLTPAFEELGRQFEQETGVKVTFSFGSTGMLAKQIENGAPVDLFAAANVEFVDQLERKGLILPETKALYARGRITIWTRSDSSLKIEHIQDLAQTEIARIAIANPEHAPYGKAAREALESAGIFGAVEPKLVYGENVRQTMQYAETGNADVAIIALSLSVLGNGRWTLIPEELHAPLDQALAVIKGARREFEALRFAEFINSAQGRSTMRRYGFILPGEANSLKENLERCDDTRVAESVDLRKENVCRGSSARTESSLTRGRAKLSYLLTMHSRLAPPLPGDSDRSQ